jgi:hypothetical protein
MSEPQINIRTHEPSNSALRAKNRKRSAGPWIVVGSAAVCIVAAAVIFMLAADAPGTATVQEARPAPRVTETVDSKASEIAGAADSSLAGNELVVDDPQGELIWASPTAGSAIDLAYVPAGTQCLIHLRPAALLESPDGERVLAALGPWGQAAADRLQNLLSAELSEVDSLLIAVVVGGDGALDACIRAKFHAPWSETDLAARIPNGSPETINSHSYRRAGDRAYFLPARGDRPQWLVVCPASMAPELIESGGEAPPLIRDIERLAEHTDGERTLTILVAPQFLLAGGNELLTEEAAPLHEAIEWLVGREATALLLSAHWDDDFFVELRAAPTLNVAARRLAAKLQGQVAAAPNHIEDLVLSKQWPEYGRKVVARFPAMIRTLARYSRAGEDDRQAVVRAYLPAMAGHNLVMGSELMLTQSSVNDAIAAQPASSDALPLTLDERLAKKTSLVFSKETLERAIELLAEDAGVEVVIQGADLQLEGITKNQSLAIEVRDRPLADILVEVLLRANPDRTATGPADPKQKLVYTVEPAQSGGPGRIIVTTRAAAQRRGDPLPDVFLVRKR